MRSIFKLTIGKVCCERVLNACGTMADGPERPSLNARSSLRSHYKSEVRTISTTDVPTHGIYVQKSVNIVSRRFSFYFEADTQDVYFIFVVRDVKRYRANKQCSKYR